MTVYLILSIYLLLTLLSGFIGYRQSAATPEDYFLANRGLGSMVVFFTFIATNFSAFFFLGFAGEGYRTGYSYYAMMGFGTAFAALSFYLIGFKAWQEGKRNSYITPAEMIGDKTGSSSLKLLYLLVMVFFTLPYMAVQPIGAGIILEALTDGQIPYFWGAMGLTIFIVFYVFIGGMRTVAITDMIQGVLMFGLMFGAVWVVADSLGGITAANEQVYALKPDLFSRAGGDGYFTWQKWMSLMLLWVFCVPMFPQMFMRFYVSKDLKAFKFATVMYAAVPLVLFICPVMIGVWGHLSFPDLVGREADNILPMMLNLHAPQWLAALIMTGALAAFMSTLDSQLLALSTMLTRDLYVSFVRPKAGFGQQIWMGRILVIVLAIIGLTIAFQPPATIFVIVKNAFTGLSILFPATFVVLHFKNPNPMACFLSIAIGEAFLVGLLLGWIPQTVLLGFEPVLPIVALAGVIAVGGSLSKTK